MPMRLRVAGRVRPQARDILGHRMICGERRHGGVLLPDDSFIRTWNVRARWVRVWKVGREIDWLRPGEWVLMRHGRWSLAWKVDEDGETHEVLKLDPEGILIIADRPLTRERRAHSDGDDA